MLTFVPLLDIFSGSASATMGRDHEDLWLAKQIDKKTSRASYR